MATLLRGRRKMIFVFVFIFCLGMITGSMATNLKSDLHRTMDDYPFSVLILGDSQMAGDGWNGAYANCISEVHPNALVLNLAKSGSLLANGDIETQWAYYLSEGYPMADFVLLDGGVNDLSYLRREEFKENGVDLVKKAFSSLVEQIHETDPDIRIIYMLMPPFAEWKNSDQGLPAYEDQERYWREMNMLASAYDYVTVIDLFSLNPFHYPCFDCYRKYLADSVHLNEEGYRKTYEYIDNIIAVNLARNLGNSP